MANFIRAVNRHRWFNPSNRQKALKLAKTTEKRLERHPEVYRAEFYQFWSALEKLGKKDVLEQIKSSCGCTSCKLKTQR